MSGHGSDTRYTHVATTRRKWSREEKRSIVTELDAPGATVSDVSRRHGIHTSLLFRWRREGASHCAPAPAPAARTRPAAFLPMTVSSPMPPQLPSKASPPAPARIEIQLTNGRVVRVDASVDADALGSIVAALERKA